MNRFLRYYGMLDRGRDKLACENRTYASRIAPVPQPAPLADDTPVAIDSMVPR